VQNQLPLAKEEAEAGRRPGAPNAAVVAAAPAGSAWTLQMLRHLSSVPQALPADSVLRFRPAAKRLSSMSGCQCLCVAVVRTDKYVSRKRSRALNASVWQYIIWHTCTQQVSTCCTIDVICC
jgi:hypothetical protein